METILSKQISNSQKMFCRSSSSVETNFVAQHIKMNYRDFRLWGSGFTYLLKFGRLLERQLMAQKDGTRDSMA